MSSAVSLEEKKLTQAGYIDDIELGLFTYVSTDRLSCSASVFSLLLLSSPSFSYICLLDAFISEKTLVRVIQLAEKSLFLRFLLLFLNISYSSFYSSIQ